MSVKVLVHKPTNEELKARRTKLDDVLTQYSEDNKLKHIDNQREQTNKEIIEAMQAHYPRYDKDHLYKDRLYIMAHDTFVSEMSIFRYSHTIRGMFEDIEEIQREAKKNYTHDKGFIRINSMKIGLEAIKLKEDILSGKAMDVSIELLGKKMRRMEEENNKLTSKPVN